MNRYPLWKYLIVLAALIFGLTYTLPNIFGQTVAVQISSLNVTKKVDANLLSFAEQTLKQANIPFENSQIQANGPNNTIRIRFNSPNEQIQARGILERALNPNPEEPNYVVALNLLSATPSWLQSLGANPMALGLDLRGGVHFLLQVDMKGALKSRYNSLNTELRTLFRDSKITAESIQLEGSTITALFSNEKDANKAKDVIRQRLPELNYAICRTKWQACFNQYHCSKRSFTRSRHGFKTKYSHTS